MLPKDSPERPGAKAPGRLSQALLRLLMRRATIVAAERLTDRFRLITLEGPALKDVAWSPGQKVQIAMGSAFVARTYTPIEWNGATGRSCILGFEHGDGPGSAWLRNVEPGDECDLFGPRASLDIGRATGPIAIFGDETSIGLAYALTQQNRGRSVACFFEVGDLDGARQVVGQVGIGDAHLFARRGDGEHLVQMEAGIATLLETDTVFVLTGKAATIQRLRQSLNRYGVPGANIRAKAYWAPGKKGLD